MKIEMTKEEFKEILGESFHTAFRKAVSNKTDIWNLIHKMSNDEWDSVLDFVCDCFGVT